jgi:diadenosine tetraphosphate (Ap4A) HIT family hydrolase
MPEQDPDCKICNLCLPDSHFVFSNNLWRIRHSSETDILGYCILEPQRHFLDLSEAEACEVDCYGKLLACLIKAQRQILKCERVYTFSLAEAVPHFHVHVIPRAEDFLKAYRGRGIMSYPLSPACGTSLVSEVSGRISAQLHCLLPSDCPGKGGLPERK